MPPPARGCLSAAKAGVAKNILHYLMLSYLSTVAKSLRRRNEPHFAVILTSHKDHTLRLDAADLAWSKVGKNTYLLAYHLFWRILLGDT